MQSTASDLLHGVNPAIAALLLKDWALWGRRDQQEPPGDWATWLILAGRGWGKSRCLAETVRGWVMSGRYQRLALVARTAADVRDVIVEGESGILSVHRDDERPLWEPSKRRLTWPNGAIATTYSAEEPDQLRGPQHDAAIADELAAWDRGAETWANLKMGLRLGAKPRVVVATTPRPTPLVRELISAPDTLLTRGRTRDNARNLSPGVVDALERRYGGTRLGRQELDGEVISDSAGALWQWGWIDAARVTEAPSSLRRVVVAIDPAVSSHEDSDETGIVVAGIGYDGRVYVLGDASGRYRPEEWSRRALALYDQFSADEIIAEVNNGGDMVASTIRVHRPNVNVRTVHATRGKTLRAEPIAALYERGLVSHVKSFPHLEDQLTTWDASTSKRSPDRLDALVWALTGLTDVAAPRVASEHTYDF